jgi:hypothetical protein
VKWVGPILVFLVAGCGSGSAQKEPIGSRCKSNGNCGSAPFQCETGPSYPGGYCDKPCTTDGDCPLDSVCAPLSPSVCRRRCNDNDATELCRTDSGDGYGYACVTTEGATADYCGNVPLTSTADLAPPGD